MTDCSGTHRSQLETEFDDACADLQNSSQYSESREPGYWEEDEEWDKWQGIGPEETVRIESCNWIAEAFRKTDKSNMSDADLRQLLDVIKGTRRAVDNVFNYRQTRRTNEAPQAVIEQLRNVHRELTRAAREWVERETLDDVEFESEVRRRKILRGKINTLQLRVSAILREAQTSSKEAISDMERKIEERTQEAFPSQFSVEARGSRRRGYVWCGVSLLLLVGTAWVLWDLVGQIDLERQYVLQNVAAVVVGKLALAGILGYGIVWTVKMGQACMHEASVNLHRALSLATLEKDLGGDGDSELSKQLARVCQKIPSSARSLRRTATLSAKFRPNFGPATGRTDTTEGCSASYRFAFSTSGHRRPFPPPYAGPGGEVRR